MLVSGRHLKKSNNAHTVLTRTTFILQQPYMYEHVPMTTSQGLGSLNWPLQDNKGDLEGQEWGATYRVRVFEE